MQHQARYVRCEQCQTVRQSPLELNQSGGEFPCPACHVMLSLPPSPTQPPAPSQTASHATQAAAPPPIQSPPATPQPSTPPAKDNTAQELQTVRMQRADVPTPARVEPAADQQSRFIGRKLLGCLIEEVQAHTATGVVFKARHIQLDRPVSVKVLSPQLVSDPVTVDRFLNEARTAGRIDHANLVALHDVGQDPEMGVHALVLEYVEGCTLDQRMAQLGGPLDPGEAALLLIQACQGLEAAHSAGVVHRDIKPENLLLTPDGLLKVTGFGLARDQTNQRMTEQGQILGTPAYISPEQCQSQPVDGRSDLYSLGLVGYYLMTGIEPMQAESAVATMFNQVHVTPEPPHLLRPEVDPAVSLAISRMIIKDPAQRPPSAEAAAAELRAAITQEQRSSSRRTALPGSGVRSSVGRQISTHQTAILPETLPRSSPSSQVLPQAQPPGAQAPPGHGSSHSTTVLPEQSGQRYSSHQSTVTAGRAPTAEQHSSQRLHRVLSSQRLNTLPERRWLKWTPLLLICLVIGAVYTIGSRWREQARKPSKNAGATKAKPEATPKQLYEAALQRDDREEALKQLGEYLIENSTDWHMRRERMKLAKKLKKVDLATSDLAVLASVGQTSQAETEKLLAIWNERDQHTKATALVEQVSRRNPYAARRLAMLRVDYLVKEKEYPRAIALLKRLVRGKPDVVLSKRLALVLIRARQGVEAARALLRVPPGADVPEPAPTQQILRKLRPLLEKQLAPGLATSQLVSGERSLLVELSARDPHFYLYAYTRAAELLRQGNTPTVKREIVQLVDTLEGTPSPRMWQAIAALALQADAPVAAAKAVAKLPHQHKLPRELLARLRRGLGLSLQKGSLKQTVLSSAKKPWLSGLARRDPTFYLYRLAAGLQRLGAGDRTAALAHFSAGLKLAPKNAPASLIHSAHAGQADCYLALGRHREALTESRWCLERSLRDSALEPLLLQRFQAQLGLKQKTRARNTLTLISWISDLPLGEHKRALQQLTGSDKLSSDAQVRRAYEVKLHIERAAPPLEDGDQIVACDGQPVHGGLTVRQEIRKLAAGKRGAIELTLTRKKEKAKKVKLTRKVVMARPIHLKPVIRIRHKDK